MLDQRFHQGSAGLWEIGWASHSARLRSDPATVKKGSPHNFFLEISREIHAILLPSKFEELAHTICGECARSKIH